MFKQGPEATERSLEPLARLFKLLSDKTRLKILVLLSQGERNVTSLCQELGLPQPTVSHHLGLLRLERIIANRRNGKQVYYCLDSQVRSSDGSALLIHRDPFAIRIGLI